ncbi:calmodulin calcium-dependent NAD kinase-like [Lycium ferocissimum]|uniref:calmodulin calcium-dependent NAD kinase-like n=1 Tax=Lycium ferocissimum TaxID=112874 RepID=UPI002815FC86|nr:calmodulin calcium-dependent NAD kinase-like [Lycium ferocissimum]
MVKYGEVVITSYILPASLVGIISALAMHHLRKYKTKVDNYMMINPLAPILDTTESGRAGGRLEKFSHYVARQLGFKDESECPRLMELVQEYLKRSKGCDNTIFEYFANEEDAESLYIKLENELESCILAYFAFHWSKVSMLISQVSSVDSEQKKLKDMVLAATRKQRFEKITKDLKVTRVFSTLVDEMRAIGTVSSNGRESKCTDVMVPVAHSQRSPVLLLMGGGMGAGKSTVLKDILKQSFWSEAADNAVVVEADAFKETDVIYRAISSRGHHHDMLQTAEMVHQNSTNAASSLLVTALNEGRDVIMDGTLSWEPFVEQTIAMARKVHEYRYRMGDGYKVAEDGTVSENYWEQVEQEEGEEAKNITKPYRIELVGVVCDPYLAVVRGIRRAISTGRAVRVKSQLTSHKRFANAFPKYCNLVDNARLYCTNTISASRPSLIAWKDGENKLLVEPEDIKCLEMVKNVKEEAESIYELYEEEDVLSQSACVWKNMVLLPARSSLQQELKTAIVKIENLAK